MDVDGSWQEPPIPEVYIVILLRLASLPPAKSLQGVSSEDRETLWKAPSWQGCWLSP